MVVSDCCGKAIYESTYLALGTGLAEKYALGLTELADELADELAPWTVNGPK